MSRRFKIVLIAALAVLVAGTSVAIAAWLVSGSGNGTAKAGNLGTLTVNSATASPDLYPGGTGKLYLNVTTTSTIPLEDHERDGQRGHHVRQGRLWRG